MDREHNLPIMLIITMGQSRVDSCTIRIYLFIAIELVPVTLFCYIVLNSPDLWLSYV
jgi:hypothetical protein